MSMAENLKTALDGLQKRLDNETVGDMTASYLFDLGDEGFWFLKFEEGKGSLTEGSQEAECNVTMTSADLIALLEKKATSQELFMTGKLKIKGNMGLAMKLQKVLG